MLDRTKAQRILALYDGRRTTGEIAEIVGCHSAYVRVVARQRKGNARSEHDHRYANSSLGIATRLKSQERSRPYHRAYSAALVATADTEAANAAARRAYRTAVKQGRPRLKAKAAASAARSVILVRTGDQNAARAAARAALGKQIF